MHMAGSCQRDSDRCVGRVAGNCPSGRGKLLWRGATISYTLDIAPIAYPALGREKGPVYVFVFRAPVCRKKMSARNKTLLRTWLTMGQSYG